MKKDRHLIDWLNKSNYSTKEDLNVIKNEISVVFSQNPLIADSFNRYQKTASYVNDFFEENKLDYSCIKAIRVYSHFNTDLNIAIRKEDFKRIIKLLEKDGWSRRSWWSQFKENIAEHGKRKLVCNKDRGLSEIHLYPGLSWHGFEYTSPEDVLNNREKIQLFNSDVFNTNNCLDLISNIGHALFERYKITSGEVFHLQSILNDISDDQMSLAEDISKKNGWHNGFMLMKDFISEKYEEPAQNFPILINKNILWSAWIERFNFQIKNLRFFSALIEMVFNLVWSGPVYKLYSAIKKLFTGKTGIEKKYGDIR